MQRLRDEAKTDDDTSGVHLWLVLWKAYDAISKRAQASIAELGLGMSDFAVLEVLLHKGPLPVNTIGAKVLLTSGSISVAIDRLESKGFVERCGTKDRRTRVVHLTDSGRELIRCAFARHAATMESIAASVSPEERITLLNLLKKLGGAKRDAVDLQDSGKPADEDEYGVPGN